MPHVGHSAIRARGTIGGSLALADPAAELPACVVALDATIRVGRRGGSRDIAADDFFRGHLHDRPRAGGDRHRDPGAARRRGVALGVRRAGAPPRRLRPGGSGRAGAAVTAGAIAPSRGSYSSVSARGPCARGVPRPRWSGRRADAETLAAAGRALDDDLDPPGDVHGSPALRRHLARVLLARVVGRLVGGAAREDHADRQRRADHARRRGADRTWSTFSATTSGFTGSHVGCEHGVCGACTVRVDGTPIRGCLMLAAQADGCRVETIEGVVRHRRDRRAPAGLPRGERAPVRLLHAGHAADRAGAARARPRSRPGGDSRGHRRQLLPLHRLSRDRAGGPGRGAEPIAPAGARPRAPARDPARTGSYIGRSVVRPQTRAGSWRDAAPTPTTWRCPRSCTWPSCARRTRTRASSGIDTAEAAALPGVVAVVTGREMAAHCEPWVGVLKNYAGMKSAPQYPLAAGQGGVAGRAGGRGGGGVARARRGRRRARARDVGAAAAGGGRGGRARARSDRHPSRAGRQPRARDADQVGRRGRRVRGRRTRCTGTPSIPAGTPWSASSRASCWPTTTRPTRRLTVYHSGQAPYMFHDILVPPSADSRAPRARDQQGRGRLLRAQDPHLSRRDRDLRAGGDAGPRR